MAGSVPASSQAGYSSPFVLGVSLRRPSSRVASSSARARALEQRLHLVVGVVARFDRGVERQTGVVRQ